MEIKLKNQTQAFLIHLTDTYFIQEIKVGDKLELPGFARIGTLIDKVKKNVGNSKTLVLHSGDFLFPSYMSKFFDGKQMVEILNACGFDYITLGNHDFDGGLAILKKRLKEANFKIILTNLQTPKNFPVKSPSHVLWPKSKPVLALVGIAGASTQRAATENGFSKLDVTDSLKKKIKFLKQNYPYVINLVVLSHMSNYEDEKLVKWLSVNWHGFSYIFGGHDHNNVVSSKSKASNSILIKSQSNGRVVRLYPILQTSRDNRRKIKRLVNNLKNNLITIDSKDFEQIPESPKIIKKINKWESRLRKIAPEKPEIVKKFPAGISFDATELSLRKGTTNFGNFIADCLCEGTKSDIAMINSGHFRGDRTLANVIQTSDLRRIFVMDDPRSIIKVKLSPKECRLLLLHGYKEPGKGRILQISKNTPNIIKKSKKNLSAIIMTDMIFTDDDGFAKILAKQRKISVTKLRKSIKKFRIDQTIMDLVKKQAKFVKYDPSKRFQVKDVSRF